MSISFLFDIKHLLKFDKYINHIFEIFNKKLKIDESCEKIDDGIVYILDHKNKTEIYKVYKSGILLYKIHTE